MKKLLLSMATVAVCFGANAGTTVLDVTNYDKSSVDGDFVEQANKEDGSVQAYAHYQPLNAMKIGDYEFEFSAGSNKNAPALYDSKAGTWTIRLYYGNSMTIMAPEGASFASIKFVTTNGKSDWTGSADKGTLKMNYTSETNQFVTWSNAEAVSTLNITVDQNIRISSIELSTEAGSVVPDPEPIITGEHLWSSLLNNAEDCDWTFENIILPEAATYIWSWKSYNGNYYLNGSAFVANVAYASEAIAVSPVVDLTEGNKLTCQFDHAAKYQTSLKEMCGLLIREEGATEWTELTIPTWPDAGAWAFANSGSIDINAYAGKKVQFGFKYGSTDGQADTWEINNFYVDGEGAGVEGVEAVAGEARYFDLQGRRVANPDKGLFVKVQGGKATKVLF